MSTDTPIVLITPDAKAALEAEVKRSGIIGGLTGGLLFGYPLDERHRLVVSSVRLSQDVGFGQRDFALDQTRTSRQLKHAQSLGPEATYCGVWYIHRTPYQELTVEEWTQTQNVLEDPDFRFKDLVCLVLCFYQGELKIYASSFNRHHSARGQPPAPTQLQPMTDSLLIRADLTPPPTLSPAPTNWFDSPDVAARLRLEHERLAQKYHVEPALMPDLHHAVPVPDVVEHRQGVGHVQGYGLFAEDRDPGVHAGLDELRVGPGSGGDDQPVQPRGQQRLDRGQEFGTETACHRPGVLFGDVGEAEPDTDPLRVQDLVEGGDVVGVHDPDPPDADESKDYVSHTSTLRFGTGTVNAARKASRAA